MAKEYLQDEFTTSDDIMEMHGNFNNIESHDEFFGRFSLNKNKRAAAQQKAGEKALAKGRTKAANRLLGKAAKNFGKVAGATAKQISAQEQQINKEALEQQVAANANLMNEVRANAENASATIDSQSIYRDATALPSTNTPTYTPDFSQDWNTQGGGGAEVMTDTRMSTPDNPIELEPVEVTASKKKNQTVLIIVGVALLAVVGYFLIKKRK